MKRFRSFRGVHGVLTLGLLIVSGSAWSDATQPALHVGWHVHEPTRFVVSGVLRKIGSTDVIKPIQSVIEASVGDVAVQAFAQAARRQYPDYVLISTIVSRVPNTGTCESLI